MTNDVNICFASIYTGLCYICKVFSRWRDKETSYTLTVHLPATLLFTPCGKKKYLLLTYAECLCVLTKHEQLQMTCLNILISVVASVLSCEITLLVPSCQVAHLPLVLDVLPLSVRWFWETVPEQCGWGAVGKHCPQPFSGQTPAWGCHQLLHRAMRIMPWPCTLESSQCHIKMSTLEICLAVSIVTLYAGQDGLHPHCQVSLLRVHGDSLRVWLVTVRARRGPPCRQTCTGVIASFTFPQGLVSCPHLEALACSPALHHQTPHNLFPGTWSATSQRWIKSAAPHPSPGHHPFCLLVVVDYRPVVWGSAWPWHPAFIKTRGGVLGCIMAEVVRGLPAACVQNQGCAETEEQLFIAEIQWHMVPACHFVPYHPVPYYPTHAPIPLSCASLSCHAGTASHNLYLISRLGAFAGTLPPNLHFFPPQKSFMGVFYLSQCCCGLLWCPLFWDQATKLSSIKCSGREWWRVTVVYVDCPISSGKGHRVPSRIQAG